MKWLRNWFSNMEPYDEPFRHESDGIFINYSTVEHFFQGMKIVDGKKRKEFVKKHPNPYYIKQAAKKIELRADWEDIKQSVMWTGLLWKFRPKTMWADTLISTYDKDIVEWNNWHDNYWGWCICTRCQKSVLNPRNQLGKFLEKIRKELILGHL